MDRPLCKCHGEPMVCPDHWQCVAKKRERDRRYDEAHREERHCYYEAHREELVEQCRRYRQTHREQEAERNHRYDEAHREEKAERNRRYHDEYGEVVNFVAMVRRSQERLVANRVKLAELVEELRS